MHKFIFFAFIFFMSAKGFSQDPFIINDEQAIHKVSKNIFYFEDKTSTLNVPDVLSRSFTGSNTEVPNFSISKSAFWLKFTLRNQTPDSNLVIHVEHATLDSVTLYTLNEAGNGVSDSMVMTENVDFNKRDYEYQTYVFNTKLVKGTEKTYLLRVKASEQILVPVLVGTERRMLENFSVKDLIFGIYAGIILVMIFYNLFLSFSIKDAGYIYYVAYILFVGLTQAVLQGYAFRFLWPHHPVLNSYAGVLVPFFNGIAAIEFIKHFLNLKKVSAWMNNGMNIIIMLYLVSLVLFFAHDSHIAQIVIQITAFAGSFYALFIFIILVKRRHQLAKVLLIAWLFFLASVIVFVLRNFGVLPYNDFTFYALQMGSSAEALLLSLALANKINFYRKERIIAQNEAFRVSLENEKLIREQNITLEKEVQLRTSELQQVNEDLNQTLSQLKATQTKLVDSEKMASLGQLTAGIAHEINNPINFVASNIKPLELDIKDIFEVIDQYENIDLEKDIKPQMVAIESYKQQIDLDYIKNEVNALLLGIKEGSNRTAEIVRNLKNFARVDQDNMKFADLNNGIESTVMLLRNSFPTNLVFDKHLSPLPDVECVPGKINQVFMNIITNALHAIKAKTYADGETGRLTLLSELAGDSVKITIGDNGIGMTEETRAKIFEPFFTTKAVGEGTGLGMSIVKGIVGSHNGSIDIESIPGLGTKFIITLPVKSLIN